MLIMFKGGNEYWSNQFGMGPFELIGWSKVAGQPSYEFKDSKGDIQNLWQHRFYVLEDNQSLDDLL